MSVIIQEVHVIFSGFQQRTATINGTVRAEDCILRIVQNRPSVRVILLPWTADVVDLAERISKTQPDDGSVIVNVYGYSWGGQTSVNFARELRRRSINVNEMVLTDPVYRAQRALFFLFWMFQWRAFLAHIPIRIPDNVKRVVWFRQRQNYPRGHNLKADNPIETEIAKAVEIKSEHCWMDDHPLWIRACEEAARRVGVGINTQTERN